MSYAIDVKPKPLLDLLAFDIAVQERALDEIDFLAEVADVLPRRPLPIEADHEAEWTDGRERHILFIGVVYVPKRRVMQVIRVGHVIKPAISSPTP